MILRPKGAEISLSSANTVANATLVRVINLGPAGVLHFSNTGGEYGNLTVTNTEFVVVQKAATDTLSGASMMATPIAYKA
jgi:hypothetical protein